MSAKGSAALSAKGTSGAGRTSEKRSTVDFESRADFESRLKQCNLRSLGVSRGNPSYRE